MASPLRRCRCSVLEVCGWVKKEKSDGRRLAKPPVFVGSMTCSHGSDGSEGASNRRNHRGPHSGAFNGVEMLHVVLRGR